MKLWKRPESKKQPRKREGLFHRDKVGEGLGGRVDGEERG
jgi:hypothetical protein